MSTCSSRKRRLLITDRGDPEALLLVDGRGVCAAALREAGRGPHDIPPHYSRQSVGARAWCRNGESLVLISEDGLSVWCSFRPSPGKAIRPDKLNGYECSLFRNENRLRKAYRSCTRYLLSSDLVREAVEATLAVWGLPGRDGFFTFIKPDCIASQEKGRCYLEAGWTVVGAARDGKPRLSFVQPFAPPGDWRQWRFKPGRGGALRERLERPQGTLPLWEAA